MRFVRTRLISLGACIVSSPPSQVGARQMTPRLIWGKSAVFSKCVGAPPASMAVHLMAFPVQRSPRTPAAHNMESTWPRNGRSVNCSRISPGLFSRLERTRQSEAHPILKPASPTSVGAQSGRRMRPTSSNRKGNENDHALDHALVDPHRRGLCRLHHRIHGAPALGRRGLALPQSRPSFRAPDTIRARAVRTLMSSSGIASRA